MPGEFKIYGNQASTTLSVNELDIFDLKMYPNPSDDFIMFNQSLDSVRIYDITGKELIVYKNIYKGQQLSTYNLDPGYYIVKIENNNMFSTKALIKK